MRFLLSLVLLLVAGCQLDAPPETPTPTTDEIPFRQDGQLTFLRADGAPIVTIGIEIAEGDSAITRGLMDRTSLPDRSGMLFLMPQERMQTFWMANTPISLDITFVSADSVVVNTGKYTRPFTQDQVASEAPARYVIETPAGFTDRWGIVAGDRVSWHRSGADAALP